MMIKGIKLITKDLINAYRTSRPRILSILPKLQQYGWTKDDLFRIGRLPFPYGPWGLAWYPIWLNKTVKAHILEDGTVEFRWKDPHGNIVKQTVEREFSKQKRRKTWNNRS